MAFFGITALGPPNIFKTSLINALGLTVYTDEEYEEAFKRVDKDGSGAITKDEVEELLFETYGYPALEEEVAMFMEDFDANADGKVTLEEFKTALNRMRKQLDSKKDVAAEYKSHSKMCSDRFKHIRMNKTTEEKYKVPLTFNQTFGFKVLDPRAQDLVQMERHPIWKCAETKYADEMIRTGFPM